MLCLLSLKPATEVNYRRLTVQTVTEYTPSSYREINHNLLVGVVTQQAAELIDVVANLPTTP